MCGIRDSARRRRQGIGGCFCLCSPVRFGVEPGSQRRQLLRCPVLGLLGRPQKPLGVRHPAACKDVPAHAVKMSGQVRPPRLSQGKKGEKKPLNMFFLVITREGLSPKHEPVAEKCTTCPPSLDPHRKGPRKRAFGAVLPNPIVGPGTKIKDRFEEVARARRQGVPLLCRAMVSSCCCRAAWLFSSSLRMCRHCCCSPSTSLTPSIPETVDESWSDKKKNKKFKKLPTVTPRADRDPAPTPFAGSGRCR